MEPSAINGASRQGGAFSAKQARTSVRWERLRQWEQDELIVRESPRFYRLAEAGDDVRSRMLRAQARIGQPLIACHSTAAELHGFNVLEDDRLHVTTARSRSIRSGRGVIVHQLVPRSSPTTVDGVIAIDAADTAVDLAAAAQRIDVLAILDAALRNGLTVEQVDQALGRSAGRRGVVQVRSLLAAASPAAQSPMESRTRYRLLEAGLPRPELQVKVSTPSGVRYLDHGWRRARVGLEFDGQDFHSGDGSLDKDRRRHGDLLAAGWTIMYVTASDVYRTPARFTEPLRTLLHERGVLDGPTQS